MAAASLQIGDMWFAPGYAMIPGAYFHVLGAETLRRKLPVSERRICRVLGQHRSTHRKVPRGAEDEQRLTDDIIALAKQYGRYGYRRVTALLRDAGWTVTR